MYIWNFLWYYYVEFHYAPFFVILLQFQGNTFEYCLRSGIFRPVEQHPELKWRQVLYMFNYDLVCSEEIRNILGKQWMVRMLNNFDDLSERQKYYFTLFLSHCIKFKETSSLISKVPQFWTWVNNVLKPFRMKNMTIEETRMRTQQAFACLRLLIGCLTFWGRKRIKAIPKLFEMSLKAVKLYNSVVKQRCDFINEDYTRLWKIAPDIDLNNVIDLIVGLKSNFEAEFKEYLRDKDKSKKVLLNFVRENRKQIDLRVQKFKETRGESRNAIPERVCANCGKEEIILEKKLKACSNCNSVFYCGKKCQKKHWNKGHENTCEKLFRNEK